MSKLKLSDFKSNDEVVYVPYHAEGDRAHPDCMWGRVSSINDHYVFVRFNDTVSRLGWEGATSKACKPDQLQK